jgi:phosphoglycolate phosphatase
MRINPKMSAIREDGKRCASYLGMTGRSHTLPTSLSAVVFDLDGTLVDSATDIAAALNELLEIRQLAPFSIEDVVGFVGGGATTLVQRAFHKRGEWPSADELSTYVGVFRVLYRERLTSSTRPYPGAVEALSRLRQQGISSAICTNKEETLARSMIKALGLECFFSTIVGGSPERLPKPSPAPLKEAIARLGAPHRDSVVMVGDSEADIRSARAAGVKVICVSFGYSRVPVLNLGADVVIDSYAELETACQFLLDKHS